MTSHHPHDPAPYPAEQSAPTRPWFRKKRYWAGGVAALVIVGSALGQSKNDTAPAAASASSSSPTQAPSPATSSSTTPATTSAAPSVVTVTTTAPASEPTDTPAATPATQEPVADTSTTETTTPGTASAEDAGGLGAKPQLARDAATNYLDTMPFSKRGLIAQLSSSYGDGYSLADATAAVNSLTVDWNAQAVKAANNYLDTMPFSCSALTEQLSSEYGDKYTASQAAYGAQHTKAC